MTTRRERRRLEVRGRILEAAGALFFQQGYQATTVVELAERADVAKKTLFNHFPTKQDVLRALAERVFENLLVDLETARKSQASTRQRLLAFFGRVEGLVADTGPAARELAWEILHATDAAGLQREEGERFRRALEDIVRDGVARGEVTRRFAPEFLAESIGNLYFTLINRWAESDDFPVARRARETAAFLAHAIERRPDEDAPSEDPA
jgi:AcrR family transcriptional regulator